MIFGFNTFSIILVGLILVTIYLIALYFQDRLAEANANEVGHVLLLGSSLLIGLKLLYTTMLILDGNLVEHDKLYTVYGGLWGMYLSCCSLYKKLDGRKPRVMPP